MHSRFSRLSFSVVCQSIILVSLILLSSLALVLNVEEGVELLAEGGDRYWVDEDVEIDGGLGWLETGQALDGHWKGFNLTTSSNYTVGWKLVYGSNSTIVTSFPNSTFTPTSDTYESTLEFWYLTNSLITRGLSYCIDAVIYSGDGSLLDSDYTCITIPSESEDIESDIIFDNSQTMLSYGWDAYNLTAGSGYLIDWSLYFNSNNTIILRAVGENLYPSGNQDGFSSDISLSEVNITRGLEYCMDSEISNDQNIPLDSDSTCLTIPTSGGSSGTDTDNDGVDDVNDDCLNGISGWTSDQFSDHDGDGCKDDSSEDQDDDNDGVDDVNDGCPSGVMSWTSDQSNDHDGDGCKDDSSEDEDDDDDGIEDWDDSCPTSVDAGTWDSWDSNPVVDFDHDGCKDADEDNDDDDDGYEEPDDDDCELTNIGAEVDSNGCQIAFYDDDGDGVADSYDDCPDTETGTSVDFWGCELGRNSDSEDEDGDGVYNAYDECWDGATGWVSNSSTDYDNDGCRDATEDWDDDDDGVGDENDECYLGATNWWSWDSDPVVDYDHDGCRDADEDDDDDGDEVDDGVDSCAMTRLGAVVDSSGCETSFPDADGDGVSDSYDICPNTQAGVPVDGWNGCPDDNGGDGGEPPGGGPPGGEDNNGSGDVIEEEGKEWWSEIPIAGEIIEQIQTKYGKIISAVIFSLGVLGYGYRLVTIRSDMVMGKRMKKYKKRIDAAINSSGLRRIQSDIERAEEKRLLPVGGFGDLLSMIEMRAEDLGLSEFLPKETLVAAGIEDTGLSDQDYHEGMEALRDAKEELALAAGELRRHSREAERVQTSRRPQQRTGVSLKSKRGSGISRPSYHPRDINRDGHVDEEDHRIWEDMSDKERAERTAGQFRGSEVSKNIVAFSKIPTSSKAPCHCGAKKQYRKCHMKKDRCPCGSKKKFLSCCAKKRNFK